jgi:hypothetical protein
MELVVDANDDALVDDLDILDMELVQSHLDLNGDVVKPHHHHHAHQKVPFPPCYMLCFTLVSHDRSCHKFSNILKNVATALVHYIVWMWYELEKTNT